jgi:transposase InsO family protein
VPSYIAMANEADQKLLNKIYYKNGVVVGRDKLYSYVRANYPERKMTKASIANWLKYQEITQLHKRHEKPKDIKSTVMQAPPAQVGIDLVDMQLFEKDKHKYLLNAVDLFSRKLYSVPLLNKEDKTVLAGFKKINKHIPDLRSVRSDRGSEFVSNNMKEYLDKQGIKQVLSAPYAPQSNGAIERANQTLKRLIHKNIEVKKSFNWVKSIDKMTNIINNTIIDGKGKTAEEIEDGDQALIKKIIEIDKKEKSSSLAKPAYRMDTKVRVYDPTNKMKSRVWSKEIFKIERVIRPKNEYGIFEYQLEGSKKKWKHEDLQPIAGVINVMKEPEQFEVSKILELVMIDGEPHYKIRWKGYSLKDATVEPRTTLLEDVPKMVRAFERVNKLKF